MFEVVNNLFLQISQLQHLSFSPFWNKKKQESGNSMSKIIFVYNNMHKLPIKTETKKSSTELCIVTFT